MAGGEALLERVKAKRTLREKYEQIYRTPPQRFFSPFSLKHEWEIFRRIVPFVPRQSRVLDVGCGTGTLERLLAPRVRHVLAVDYAASAIQRAREEVPQANVQFQVGELMALQGPYDVVVMANVLEHIEDTAGALAKLYSLTRPGGRCIVSCPNFFNPRGFVWMTLALLFDVPMSLTDVHFFTPFDLLPLMEMAGFRVAATQSVHASLGWGSDLITDFTKRLPAALKDAGLSGRVDRLLAWLEKVKPMESLGRKPYCGGYLIYVLDRPARARASTARGSARERRRPS